MSFGFVYLMANDSMPDVYKLGCTSMSPHERARVLSHSTGVPTPFRVICYIEVPDYHAVEAKLHRELERFRVNRSREFFKAPVCELIGHLFFHEEQLTFAPVNMYGEFVMDDAEIVNPHAPKRGFEAYLDSLKVAS